MGHELIKIHEKHLAWTDEEIALVSHSFGCWDEGKSRYAD